MKWWGFAIVAAVAAGLALGGAAAETVVPRIVVQQSHADPVDAAAWTSDSRYLVSASAGDRSVILWDVARGVIVERLTFPIFSDPADFEPVRVVSIAMAPDDRGASLTVLAVRGRAGSRLAAARYTVDVDLARGAFAMTGAPVVKEGSSSGGDFNLATLSTSVAMAPLPSSPDGRYRLERLVKRCVADVCQSPANGLSILRADGSQPARALTGSPSGRFDAIDLSPDGSLISRLVRIYGGGTTLVQLWDLRAGRALPTLIEAKGYDRVRWIDPRRYLVSTAAPSVTTTLLVEARSAGGPRAEVSAKIETRCLEVPLGHDGALAAVGEGACATPAVSDGTILLHPVGLGGGWIEHTVPALAGRVVTSLAATPAGNQLALVTRGANGAEVVLVSLAGGAMPADLPSRVVPIPGASAAPERPIVSDDGRLLVFASPAGIGVVTLADGTLRTIPTKISRPIPLASDGATILVGGVGSQALERYAARTGLALPMSEPALGALAGRFIEGKPLFWTASDDGTVRFWDARDGKLIVTFVSFADNQFFAYTADGRYDTNLGADSDALRWWVSDHPLQSLPSATFMRQYYQPGLIPAVLNCTVSRTCASALAPIPSVADLDRALPVVKIAGARRGARPFSAKVEVEAAGADLFDLRLFRNGQLVARYPAPTMEDSASNTLVAWRAASRIPGAGPSVRHTFDVAVPSDGRAVEFSAYAFNEDRVKGETSPVFTYRPETPQTAAAVKDPAAPVPWELTGRGPGPDVAARGRKAYVITVGVDAYDIPGRSLRFAVNDARVLSDALRAIPGYAVVPIVLTADGKTDRARKADLQAVMALLAGRPGPHRARLAAHGIDARRIERATPDDLVILTFSGHGYAEGHGAFYILSSDTRVTAGGDPIPATMISSAELSDWFGGVDAGEIAVVIDACHSAASVDAGGFRPGPMGDPGLGQLAFDKGIRVLAAAQADEEAQEDPKLGQGLLTYTLVRQGLDARHAGDFTLDKWLKGAADNLATVAPPPKKAAHVLAAIDDDGAPVQEPALFDFTEKPSVVVLRAAGSGGP